MPSTLNSPPETPSKLTMAIEKESLKSRTDLPDKPSDECRGIKISPSAVGLEDAHFTDNPIQVPSTAPVETSKSTLRMSQMSLQDEDQRTAEPEALVDDEESEDAVSDGDLEPFDWAELRSRYTREIKAISDEEDNILKEFDVFVEGFGIWAEAGAENENQRALKRLKTRERYVQIAESSLEEKKDHYIQVVDAFKKALDLLRR